MNATPNTDVRLLRLPEVLARVGMARSTLYDYIARGEFPPPRALTRHTSAWRSDEIDRWIAARPSRRVKSPDEAQSR